MSEAQPSAAVVSIHLAQAADRPDQAALYDTCFESQEGGSILPWRYDQNPHGAAVSLIARTGAGRTGSGRAGAGRAVAGYACSPRVVLHRGQEFEGALVGQTGDVMTHPDHRRQGIFASLDREAVQQTTERGWPVLFGLPNRRSAHIFTGELGWKAVGRLRPWTFVLHVDAVAREQRMRAGRLAALAVPWSHWRGNMRRGKLRTRSFDKVNVVPLPRFEASVDEVTRKVSTDWPWMVRRDHVYLNWRFLDAPSGRFQAHGAFDPAGRTVGYVVVQLPGPGEKLGYVVDLLGLDPVAVAALVEVALRHLHKAGASVARAHAIAGSWWERILRGAGFRAGKRDDFKLVIVHPNDSGHPLAQAALDPSRWYFTDGDRDDELVR